MSSTRLEDSVSMQERRFIRDLIASDPTMPSTVELAAGDDMAVLRVGGDRLHSMIDVSDGLGVDAAHLVEHDDSLAIELDANSIPARAGCSIEQALGDGEDFELLFISEGTPPSEVAGTAVSVIGRVIERGSGSGVRLRNGDRIADVSERGFEHVSGAPR